MFFLVPYLSFSFFFLWGTDQSDQGAMLVCSRGIRRNIACHLFAHLLVCVSQAGLEPVSDGVCALLFSQCNMAWRSFEQSGGLRCQSFASSWCFSSAKCDSNISIRFLIYGVHTLCLFTLVAILDLHSFVHIPCIIRVCLPQR
jgi:hypothetical protein